MKYNVYLFDLDGVLVNTDNLQFMCTLNAINEITNNDINKYDNIINIIKSTITTIEKLKKLCELNIINENQVNSIYDLKKQKADEHFSKLLIDNDKIELMKYLKNNNCKIGVITNGNKKSTNIILNKIGIEKYIDLIITNEDVTYPKPNAEPYLIAIKILNNNDKSNCIIFEDSEVGITSAKNSGCMYYIIENYKDVNIDLIKKINSD